MKQIPNLFTLLNLVFGTLAIIFILQTNETIVYIDRQGFTSINLPEKLAWGSLFIFIAAIIDFLDGFVARLFKATSEMGKQLDSLADVVSFGVAPGLIMYQLLRMSYAQEVGGLETYIAWLLPALLVPCAAAWRLARFNISTIQLSSFQGLPAPAGGLFIAAIPLVIYYRTLGLEIWLLNRWVIYIIIIFISYLMVSKLHLMSLKIERFTFRSNFLLITLLITGVVTALFLQWLAVPVVVLVYITLSLFLKKKTI